MLILLLGVLVRLCLTLHSYSGKHKPPMYGDYEAQRHWMEITYNLPIKEWYFNSTDNDLMYWGLDYPPLTAYHSYLCGHFAAMINTSYVDLHKSRGLESVNHKLFMRFTVLIADLATFIPSFCFFYLNTKNRLQVRKGQHSISENESTKLCILLALLYPGIILVDHGHFQYNCVSLGFFVFSVLFIACDRHIVSSILFCLALTYKQMELYHALPFFFFHLGNCYHIFKNHGFFKCLHKLLSLGLTVLTTLAIVCFPFVTNFNQGLQLIARLFPVARGVFEDKVANMWCLVNLVYKLKILMPNEIMVLVCLVCTSLAVIPCCYDVFKYTSFLKFKYSLINSALAFFLFSYQVHEKTILLVAIPVLLVLPHDPLACTWFLVISVFSMLPLLLKDQLLTPFIATNVLFICIFISSSYHKISRINDVKSLLGISNYINLRGSHVNNLFYCSLAGCSILTAIISVAKPPLKYPDIFSLIIYVYCCVHFIAFFVYFNIVQWKMTDIKNKHQ